MKQFLFNQKANVKGVLFVIGIVLIVSGIFYSQQLVNTLKENSTAYTHFRIKVFETNINNPNMDTDINFLFNDVIQGADYPIIYTDTKRVPQSWTNLGPELDKKQLSDITPEDSVKLARLLQEMASQNEPIPITYQNNIVLGYYYYGLSPVIQKLQLFPFIAIGAAALFILIGYFGFSYIKKSEQRFIWVGMAKETAHQLGTPLSSISGWVELIKLDPEMLDTAVDEINKDLNRLNKIANRFSKIGSVPTLKDTDLTDIIETVIDYFQRRLPNMQKRVTLHFESLVDSATLPLNSELFEWVLENLIKNSIDAMENQAGKIRIRLSYNKEKQNYILDVSDNGRGMTPHQKKNLFKPGFSTKKRGWGLGLSLARRIIEEYHGGKLFLKESRPGEGSTFRMILG
jgi:signal transduction histidine kinase